MIKLGFDLCGKKYKIIDNPVHMHLREAETIIKPFITKINYRNSDEWKAIDDLSPFYGLYGLAMLAVEEKKDFFRLYFNKVEDLFSSSKYMHEEMKIAIKVLHANLNQSYSFFHDNARPRHIDLEKIATELFDSLTYAYEFPNKIDDVYLDRFYNAVVSNNKIEMKAIHLKSANDIIAFLVKSRGAIVSDVAFLDDEQIGFYLKKR